MPAPGWVHHSVLLSVKSSLPHPYPAPCLSPLNLNGLNPILSPLASWSKSSVLSSLLVSGVTNSGEGEGADVVVAGCLATEVDQSLSNKLAGLG